MGYQGIEGRIGMDMQRRCASRPSLVCASEVKLVNVTTVGGFR